MGLTSGFDVHPAPAIDELFVDTPNMVLTGPPNAPHFDWANPILSNVRRQGKPVLDWGALGVEARGQVLVDLVTVAGNAAVQAASANFPPEAATEHWLFIIPKGVNPTTDLETTIQTWTDAQHVTLAAAPSVTFTALSGGTEAAYGPDYSAQVQTCISTGIPYQALPETGVVICDEISAGWANIRLIENEGRTCILYQKRAGHPIIKNIGNLKNLTFRGLIMRGIGGNTGNAGNTAIYLEASGHGAGHTNHDQERLFFLDCEFYNFQNFCVTVSNCWNAYARDCLIYGSTQGMGFLDCSDSEFDRCTARKMRSIVLDQVAFLLTSWSYAPDAAEHGYNCGTRDCRVSDCPNVCGQLTHDGDWMYCLGARFLLCCAGANLAPTNGTAPSASTLHLDHVYVDDFQWSAHSDATVSGNSQYKGLQVYGEPANINTHGGNPDATVSYAQVTNVTCWFNNRGPQANYQPGFLCLGAVALLVIRNLTVIEPYGQGVILDVNKGPIVVDADGITVINGHQYGAALTPITLVSGATATLTGRIDNIRLIATDTVTVGIFCDGNCSGIAVGPRVRASGTFTRYLYSTGTGAKPAQLDQRRAGHLWKTDGVPAAAARAGAGTGATVALDLGSTDARGSFTLTAGSTPGAAPNNLVRLTWGVAFPNAGGKVRTTFRAADTNAAALGTLYPNNDSGGAVCDLNCTVAPVNGTAYVIAYDTQEVLVVT